jgi:hypothetical protein
MRACGAGCLESVDDVWQGHPRGEPHRGRGGGITGLMPAAHLESDLGLPVGRDEPEAWPCLIVDDKGLDPYVGGGRLAVRHDARGG